MAVFAIMTLSLAALVFGGAWLVAGAMRPVRSIPEICDEAIRDHFKRKLPALVDEVLREPQFKWFWFVKEMQWEMMRVDPKLSGEKAWGLAITAYRQNLADEGVEFGHPDYAWDKGGAIDLIHAYEIDHWERAQ